MNKWLAFALAFSLTCLVSVKCSAETGAYVEGGISFHQLSRDCPEYCGSNPLGHVGVGYTYDINAKTQLDLSLTHKSSIPDYEVGHGLNEVILKIRGYF